MPDAEPPALPRVKVIGGLVEPTLAENEPRFGERTKLAAVTTVGVTGTVLTTPPELHTMLSLFAPGVLALNVKAYAQGMFAAMIPAQVVLVASAVRSAPLGRQDRSVSAAPVVTMTATGTL
jgi:hypothetical protein